MACPPSALACGRWQRAGSVYRTVASSPAGQRQIYDMDSQRQLWRLSESAEGAGWMAGALWPAAAAGVLAAVAGVGYLFWRRHRGGVRGRTLHPGARDRSQAATEICRVNQPGVLYTWRVGAAAGQVRPARGLERVHQGVPASDVRLMALAGGP